ncbi:MAG: FAD-dependent oxidoreductase [Clostridia bacterium]|nr:FAD-dependent oxidoreductase [Clostridia bacterium]
MRKSFTTICLIAIMTLLASVSLAQEYTPGVYEATGMGNNGQISVSVTFSETAITDIQILDHSETPGIGDNAIDKLIPDILENQSLGVDTIGGATNTSSGILEAVTACVVLAGGDVEALSMPVEKTAGETIEKSADVVIIGAGGAGIAAALTAAEEGASVLIIDKAGSVGGNTIISGGVFNAADPQRQTLITMGDSSRRELESYLEFEDNDFGDFAPALITLKDQIRSYLDSGETYLFDSPELHIVQTYIGSRREGLDGSVITADYELVKILCENALDAFHWTEEIGVEYEQSVVQAVGALWQRTHNPAPTGTGERWFSVFTDRLASTPGIELMTETEATQFILDGDKVVGVQAVMKDGTEVVLNAAKNVILASGGFASNIDMIKEYNNYWPAIPDVPSDAAATCNGDGILMAQEIGANLIGMGYVQLLPTTAYPDGVAGLQGNSKMFINKEGVRFVNESAERDVLSAAGLAQTDGMFYCVADANYLDNRTWDQVTGWEAKGYLAYADTLEEAAEKMGLDPAVVRETIDRFNGFVDNEEDLDFGRYSFKGKVETAPFIIIAMSPAYHHTMGGVEIDTQCRVINTQSQPIQGLYAAGEVCGGIHAGNRLGGNAIADVFVFGRIAGRNAAV